ncbi:MAG: trypsin-like peptidase domain-containing protein [bacterium]|nr:trypsin-like peptidase domain-containing protein [bacterium]
MEQDQNLSVKNDRSTMVLLLVCVGLGFIGGLVGAGVVNQRVSKNPINTGVNLNTAMPQRGGSGDSIVNVVDQTSPAVVAISIIKNIQQVRNVPVDPFDSQFFGQSPFRIQVQQPTGTPIPQEVGGGSGFIVDSSGLIITNKHVVSDESASYEVVLKSGDRLKAKVVAQDPLFDLAILKVEKTNLPTLQFADSSKIKVGQIVVAIGNPLGEFPNSVSAGIVSGIGRQVQAGNSYTGEVETLNSVIQTDAAINPGNSGGPLLDLSGQVVGVNSATAGSAENISFAIPANEASRAISDYKKDGRVVRAILGVRYVSITPEIKDQNKLAVDHGALVVSGGTQAPAVLLGSGAEKAGIKEGDIITKVGGQDVTSEKSLQSFVGDKRPGDTLVLTVLSKDVEKNITVFLTEAK